MNKSTAYNQGVIDGFMGTFPRVWILSDNQRAYTRGYKAGRRESTRMLYSTLADLKRSPIWH